MKTAKNDPSYQRYGSRDEEKGGFQEGQPSRKLNKERGVSSKDSIRKNIFLRNEMDSSGRTKAPLHRREYEHQRKSDRFRDGSSDFYQSHMFDESRDEALDVSSRPFPRNSGSSRNTVGQRRDDGVAHARTSLPSKDYPRSTSLRDNVFDTNVCCPADAREQFPTIFDYHENYLMKEVEKTVRRTTTKFLEGTVLGVDVRYWLRRLEPHRPRLFSFTQRQEAVDTVHITKNIILQELLRLRDLNVTVLLVLNGMEKPATQKIKESQRTAQTREQPGVPPSDSRERVAHSSSASSDVFQNDLVINELLEICWEYRSSILSHVQCVRAPGDAIPQLSYYERLSLVDYVFGPPWIFWADAQIPAKIILDIQNEVVFYAECTQQIATMTERTKTDPIILQNDGVLRGISKPLLFPTETMLLHLTIGLINPSLIDAAITLRIVDDTPRYDSRELRVMLEQILPLRTQMIRMLMKNQRSVHSQVQWVRWYIEGKPTEVALPPVVELDEWELEGLDFVHPPSFISAINLIQQKAYTRGLYTSMVQYSHALHLKFLDFLGFFIHRDIKNGRQMFPRCEKGVFSETLLNTHPLFAESMVLFIEFVRTKSLRWVPLQHAMDFSFFDSPFREQLTHGKPESDEVQAVLLSRLFSFVPIEFEDDSFTHADTASTDLKAFWEIFHIFRQTLLHVAEVISVVDLPMVEFSESLLHEAFGYFPFKRVVSPFLGAVMEHLIVIARSSAFQAKTKEAKMHYLKSKFPHIKNLPYSMSIGFQWIDEVLRVVQHLFEFMEDEEPQSTKEYVCHLVYVLRHTKFYSDKIKLQIFD